MTPMNGSSRGFFLPLLIVGILSVAFFIFFVSSLGSNYLTQVAHEEEGLRCRVIGESVLTMVLAQIRNAPWKSRFFAPTPFREENVALFSGTYSLYVVDAPGLPDQVDIYVEARFGRARRLFFWRYRHERSILDVAGRVLPVLFTAVEGKTIPGAGQVSPMADTVAEIVNERRQNQERARAKVGALAGVSQLQDVINILDGPQENVILAQDRTGLENLPPVAAPPPPPPPSPPSVPGSGRQGGTGTGSGTGTSSGTGTGTGTGTGSGSGTGTSSPPDPDTLPPGYVDPTFPDGKKIVSGSGSARTIGGVIYGEATFVMDDGSKVTVLRGKIVSDAQFGGGKATLFYKDGTQETFPP